MRKIGYVSAFLFLSLLLGTGNSFTQRLDAFTVSQLIGTELNTQENLYVGQISGVVFGPQGQIASVILSDARGMGSKRVAIPYSAISKIGDHTFVYNTPENVYYFFYSDASPSFGLDVYSKEPMPGGEQFSRLIGATVQTAEGEKVARIDNVVINSEDGHVIYCVLSDVGGMEHKMVTVPFNSCRKGVKTSSS